MRGAETFTARFTGGPKDGTVMELPEPYPTYTFTENVLTRGPEADRVELPTARHTPREHVYRRKSFLTEPIDYEYIS